MASKAILTTYIDGYKAEIECDVEDLTKNVAVFKQNGWSYTWTDFDKTKSIPGSPVTFQTGSQRMLNKKVVQENCPHTDSFEFTSKYPPTVGKRMRKCNTCGKSWLIDKWQEAEFNDPARNGF